MKTFKQRLAILLSVSMILTGMVPAYATPMDTKETDIKALEETYTENVVMEDASSENAATENAATEDTAAEIIVAETVDIIDNIAEETPIEASMENEAEELLGDAHASVSYIDYENGVKTQKTVDDYVPVASTTTAFEDGKFYVVNGDVTIDSRITNTATSSSAHLILTDGCELHVKGGIKNETGKGLVIYGQTDNSGILLIDNVNVDNAGIGGEYSSAGGTIIINGGTVNATGGDMGAGIGGGDHGDGGTITINGGTVNATGEHGAGIGGGYSSAGGTITINGGTVNATGGDTGAGIGGDLGAGGTIIINGGTVNATGGNNGAGIGGGYTSAGGTIIINGGTVTTTGGTTGAGIGGGGFGGSGGTITINGGTVTATGGESGAGIGGGCVNMYGYGGAGGTIRIINGIVTAIGGDSGAGIGGGEGGAGGTITIIGGRVTATGTGWGAGIGGGEGGAGGELSFVSVPSVLKAGSDAGTAIASTINEYILNHQNYPYAYIDYYYAGYTVNHYKQKKIDVSEYALADTEIKYGFPGTLTEAAANNYEGYRVQPIKQKEIASNSSTVVDVKYDIIYYTITFNSNGHGTAPAAIKATPGTAVHAPDAPTEEGYAFSGWYQDQSYTKEYTFNTMPEEDITLYAKWSFEVTLDAQGGNGGTASIRVASHSNMPEITIPNRPGNVFAGYFSEQNGNGRQYYDIHGTSFGLCDFDEPKTLYAYWISSSVPTEQFIVSFDSKGGSSVSAQGVASGSTVSPALTTPTREGYDFEGWFYLSDKTVPSSEKQFRFDTVIYKDYQLYAKWTPKQYVISWRSDNDVEFATSSAAYGTLPVCPDEAKFIKTGYVHTGWVPAVSIATKSTSYKATYERKLDGYHVVSFDSRGGSSVDAKLVLSGATVSVPAPAPGREGYTFAGWKLNGADFVFETTAIVKDITLTASWTAEEYVITWSVNGQTSTSSCAYGSLPQYAGSTDKDGFVFTGWKPAIQIAAGPAAYTALYAEKKDTVSFTVEFNTDGAKEYIQAQHVASGSTATKPASPSKAGHTFKGWYKAGKEILFNFDAEKITADTTIYAVWEEIPKTKYTIQWVDYDGRRLYSVEAEKDTLPVYAAAKPSRSGYIFTGWDHDITLAVKDDTYKATYEVKSAGGGGGSSSGGGGSSSGGGSSVKKTTQVQGAVTGNWTYHPDTGKWTFATGNINYVNQWALVANPNAAPGQPAADWFYFDPQGNMLTGWQQIMYNGVMTWFYFSQIPDARYGACQLGGKTPDGYTLNPDGSWAGY